MLRLLPGVRMHLYTQARLLAAIEDLDTLARRKAGELGFSQALDARGRAQNTFVTHADVTGKSGSAMVKQYRSQNRIPEQRCGSPEKVTRTIRDGSSRAILVCVDDFVGTGKSAVEGLRRKVIPALQMLSEAWPERVLLVYSAVVGYEAGRDYVERELGVWYM